MINKVFRLHESLYQSEKYAHKHAGKMVLTAQKCKDKIFWAEFFMSKERGVWWSQGIVS